MSFSAATCLTYTGTTTLGPTLEVYVDSDAYATLFATVSLNNITNNCPYYFDVPDGTTNIKLFDPVSCCYCIIPIYSNDLCTTCDLNFDSYSASTIGLIVAGTITGSCESNITDYLVSWYESGDTVNPVFTSGYGTEFQPYDYIHPLTGTSSILVPSGSYEPVIDKIVISGITFSLTGGTGTVPANLDCLPTITVNALKCDDVDGGSDLAQYTHKFAYSAQTGGVTPPPVLTTFELSSTTNYFAWRFKGETIPDEIKFTFVGSAYTNPIVLDYWRVGFSGNSYALNPATYPKQYQTSDFFGKVIPLTGITVNTGDNILIEVYPSTANTQTSWTLYCGCLDSFDCDVCLPSSASTVSGTTSYQYKISADTITAITETCGVRINMSIIADCPYSAYTGSSYYLYAPNYSNVYAFDTDDVIIWGSGGVTTNLVYYNQTRCTFAGGGASPFCISSGSSVNITYDKSSGLFRVTSNSLSLINTQFYQPYLTNIVPNISSFSGDNTNVGYYRYFTIYYTDATGSETCGDASGQNVIFVHQSSVVTTGTTGMDYYIDFTLPTISYGMSYTTCDVDCINNALSVVSSVNSFSTGTTFNYTGTTNQGIVIQNGVFPMTRLVETSGFTVTATTIQGFTQIFGYNDYTFPYSGSPATIIPSLSAKTCDVSLYFNNGSSQASPTSFVYIKYYYYYIVEFFDVLDLSGSYRIYAAEINSYGLSNLSVKTLVYELTGGVVTYTDSQYLV